MPRAPKTLGQLQREQTGDPRAGFRGRKRQQAKLRVWLRDDCQCKGCKKPVTLENSKLDHIMGLASHDDWNLQTLCDKCHNAKTAGENR